MREPHFWTVQDKRSRASAPMTKLLLTPLSMIYRWAGRNRIAGVMVEGDELFDHTDPVVVAFFDNFNMPDEIVIYGPVLGIAWDGTGFGSDGTTWGGEFLDVADGTFRRVGSIVPFPLIGGDRAA